MVDGSGGENDHQLLRYKGSGTGFADTDTVGASYNPEAGAQVLAGVTSDPATVQDALDLINTGTLPGGVPGLGLINAVVAAEAAVTAYEKEVGTSTPSLDKAPTGNGDGKVTSTEAKAALTAAEGERTTLSTKSTGVLTAEAKDAVDAAAASKAVISAVAGGQAAVAAYDSAAAAKVAADAAVEANAAAAAAATAGLKTALKGDFSALEAAAGVTAGDFADAADVVAFLANTASNPLQRAALVTELNKVPTYGAEVVKEGNLELASAQAAVTLAEATAKLNAIDTDSTTSGVQATDYIAKSDDSKAAAELLAKATAADEKIAVVKTVVDKFASLDKSVADAQAALDKFQADNIDKVTLHDIAVGTVAATAKSDVFYFADKATGADDLMVSNFGSGDSIVLGSSFTQGSSVAAGDSNKLEFFLVQGSAGVNVIVEGVAHANASTTVDASGNVTAHTDAAVITLTGVSLADIAVNNGVITHV